MVRKEEIPNFKHHHCAHSIGLELYDLPVVTPENKALVEEDMVLVIETPYSEIGKGGFMVEDIVCQRMVPNTSRN